MEEIFGKYRQDFSEIRKLCLICHGLDLSTSTLSSSLSTWHISTNTGLAIQGLVSSNLLHLAIAIRTNLYQKNIEGTDIVLPRSAWLYYNKNPEEQPATLKQVCDKIIHANDFSKRIYPKEFEGNFDKITTQLRGEELNGRCWTMNLVLDLLAEDILAMLDEIEENYSLRS